eukprot:246596_1
MKMVTHLRINSTRLVSKRKQRKYQSRFNGLRVAVPVPKQNVSSLCKIPENQQYDSPLTTNSTMYSSTWSTWYSNGISEWFHSPKNSPQTSPKKLQLPPITQESV